MQHNTIPAVNKILYGSIAATFCVDMPFNYSDASGPISGGIRVCTIQVPPQFQGVKIDVQCEIVTAFNAATTNVVTFGTSQGSANEILPSSSITPGTPGWYPSGANAGKLRITQNTDLWMKYTQTGTAATTGLARFYINILPLDPSIQPTD